MSESKWHVIPGRGALYLEAISSDIEAWRRLANSIPDYEEYARNVGSRALGIGQSVVETSLISDDLAIGESLAGLLTEQEQSVISQAFISELILKSLKRLKHGRDIGSQGKRAQLTITHNGVLRKKVFQDDGHDIQIPLGLGLVQPGTVIEGKIKAFSSNPETGGVLRLDHRMSTSHIHGLVNPSTGEPRVNLDILGK